MYYIALVLMLYCMCYIGCAIYHLRICSIMIQAYIMYSITYVTNNVT